MRKILITFLIALSIFIFNLGCEDEGIITYDPGEHIELPEIARADHYVATWGNDNNDGSFEKPWLSWHKAVNSVTAGDTVYIRGGVYTNCAGTYYGAFVTPVNGTAAKPICIFNYPGETPVLDLKGINATGIHAFGLKLSYASNWHFKGLHFRNLHQPSTGEYAIGFVAYSCDGLILENLVVYNIGGPGIVIGENTKKVTIMNCDAFNNFDNVTLGENANGITVVGNGSETNVRLIGCRAWNNSDDGFDNYGSDGIVSYDSCWAYYNGYGEKGNGFGFKLGPNGDETKHIYIKNCIAALNSSQGFGQNAQTKPMTFFNNSTYKNGGAGFALGWGTVVFTFRNNLAYAELSNIFNANAIHDHNSWDLSVAVSDADFTGLDTSLLIKERKDGGSLPDINFMNLAPGSDLIDKGIDVGIPFSGIAPDLGTFEK